MENVKSYTINYVELFTWFQYTQTHTHTYPKRHYELRRPLDVLPLFFFQQSYFVIKIIRLANWYPKLALLHLTKGSEAHWTLNDPFNNFVHALGTLSSIILECSFNVLSLEGAFIFPFSFELPVCNPSST